MIHVHVSHSALSEGTNPGTTQSDHALAMGANQLNMQLGRAEHRLKQRYAAHPSLRVPSCHNQSRQSHFTKLATRSELTHLTR